MNKPMTWIAATLLLGSMMAGTARAEDVKIDCPTWQLWKAEQKIMYLAGYSDAVAMMGFAAAASGASPETNRKVMAAMWPEGYRAEKVADELDRLCLREPFTKMRISLVMSGIAVRVQREAQNK